MTKKPKIVLTSLQHQLRNMKCSEEDNLRQYLDKSQDLFACQNDMGAKMADSEFLDIILGALLPSYESVMNALTTVGCIYASYPRYKSNILQNSFKSLKLLSKSSKYSKIF